jgi:bifunctional isochorismate lyase/aryl carrier protein
MRKENYFSRENIASEAEAMASLLSLNRRAAPYSPEKSALLVIDMQRYFLCQDSHAFLPAAPAIVPNVQALITAFKTASRPVYFTRHANSPRDAGQMASWWRELLAADHPLGGIEAGLLPPGAPVIEKTQYDAFYHTDLELRLRHENVERLLITGVTTHLCCESTARSAFMRGFAVFMAIDGTATINRELHIASLRALAHGCAVPLLTADLLAAMAKAL